MEVPHGRSLFVIPAVTEHDPDAIFTFAELSGDIVSYVEHSFRKIGIARIEQMVAHALPVQVKFVVTQSADIGAGRSDLLSGREFAAEHRGGLILFVVRVGDPLRLPFAGRHLAGFEPRYRRSDRHTAVVVPRFDFPKVTGMRLQRSGGAAYDRLVAGFDPPRVPYVGVPGFELLGRGRHDDPVGALGDSSDRRLQFPHQAGFGDVDPQRRSQVLALQVDGLHRGKSGALYRQAAQHQCEA